MTFGQRLTGGKCFKWWETYKAEETAKEKIPKKQLEVCVWQSEASDGRRERQREGERKRDRRVESQNQRFCQIMGSFVRI